MNTISKTLSGPCIPSPGDPSWLTLILTAASYGIKTGYDYLGLKFINRLLPYRKIATASFIGFVLSNNIGFSIIPGASVRYRLYSPLGLSGLEITKIIFFYTISLWLGFFTLSSAVFLLKPMVLPRELLLPFRTDYPLGILLLIPVLIFMIIAVSWKGTVKIRGLELSLPPLRFFLPQTCIATFDWILAGSVLFVILPSGVPFSTFLSIFLIAQLAAIISQIPAGLGIFDAVMIFSLTRYFPASSILASLIVYRAVYYILPLLPAVIMLAMEEALD